ncbi:hypothetical protein [Noviherbaspirillum aerium]|uniref:hypothetical protein n=1 Tax=Noviherbaspirillum aerium TaxID=2588497 RepID=UPI00178C47B9|nr:hypothetical protein [Noviherbaspirillum aerium]
MYATDTASSTQTGSRKGRPNHSIEFKLKLAQRAREAGISVSSLALGRRAGANSGQRAAAMYTLIGTTASTAWTRRLICGMCPRTLPRTPGEAQLRMPPGTGQ